MGMFHFNENGEIEICNSEEEDCLLNGDLHFETNSPIEEIQNLMNRKEEKDKEYTYLDRAIKKNEGEIRWEIIMQLKDAMLNFKDKDNVLYKIAKNVIIKKSVTRMVGSMA